MSQLDQYIKAIEEELSENVRKKVKTDEVGTVTQVKDGFCVLSGLDKVGFGELIEFASGVNGMVIDILEDSVSTIVLGDYLTVKAGDSAKATGRTLSIPVGDVMLLRVVNALGEPVDGGSRIKSDEYYPLEKVAPGVVARRSVSVPLHVSARK
jgi:F-type H+-transporting ATPase subunit alpha